MAPPAVFLFIAACFGCVWSSVIQDNYPAIDHGWSIGDAEELITLKPNPTGRPFTSANFPLVRFVFDLFNQASHLRIFIDFIFYSWNRYQKEIAVNSYTKPIENEQTTLEAHHELERSTQKANEELGYEQSTFEANHELEGSTQKAYEEIGYEQSTFEANHELEGSTQKAYEDTESEQSTFEYVGGATTEAAAEVEPSYNEVPPRSRSVLKELVQENMKHPLNIQEDQTTVGTSKKEYFFTNLKLDRGTPGVDYPEYADIPATSFSCSDKTFIPGFYADLETGCQVFHVCSSDRRESLLCPIGTIFNQSLMKCDYWYNTNCSMAPFFFDLNIHFPKETSMKTDNPQSTTQNGYSATSEATNPDEASSNDSPSADTKQPEKVFDETELSTEDWDQITDFLPIKAKVTVYSKSGEHERKPALGVIRQVRSATMSKEELAVQEKIRRIQAASRIIDGALGLAGRIAKGTAKLVMEVINIRAKSDEKARKAEAGAKIVVEATDLAVKVAKDTAHLVSKFTIEAISHQADKSTVVPEMVEPELKHQADKSTAVPEMTEPELKQSSTSKTTQLKSRVNPRIVVKPHEILESFEHLRQSHLRSRKEAKDHALEMIDIAFEMVLGVKILPATRQKILENYVKGALSKKSNF